MVFTILKSQFEDDAVSASVREFFTDADHRNKGSVDENTRKTKEKMLLGPDA